MVTLDFDNATSATPRCHSRSGAKRHRIVQTAMRQFAETGYHESRVEDIAKQLAISKASVFQHFGSKAGLFLAAYQNAIRSFPAYLDAPKDVLAKGFFATLEHWLVRTEHLVREDYIPYRVLLIGSYGADLSIRREVNRILAAEDPYGIAPFVRWGLEHRELAADIDPRMIVSILDWTVERFQDALVTEELDPGLFRKRGETADEKQVKIQQFLGILRSAIGARSTAALNPGRGRKRERGDRHSDMTSKVSSKLHCVGIRGTERSYRKERLP